MFSTRSPVESMWSRTHLRTKPPATPEKSFEVGLKDKAAITGLFQYVVLITLIPVVAQVY